MPCVTLNFAIRGFVTKNSKLITSTQPSAFLRLLARNLEGGNRLNGHLSDSYRGDINVTCSDRTTYPAIRQISGFI
jgi:hypothetical protein